MSRKIFNTLLNIVAILFFTSVALMYAFDKPPEPPVDTLHIYEVNLTCRTKDAIPLNVKMTYYINIKEVDLSDENQFLLNQTNDGLDVLTHWFLKDPLESSRNFIYTQHADILIQNTKMIVDFFSAEAFQINSSGFVVKDIVFNQLEFDTKYKEYLMEKIEAKQKAKIDEMRAMIRKAEK